MHLTLININVSNNIYTGKESQLSVPRFRCAQTRLSRHVLPSSRTELAPSVGEICGVLPLPAPATCSTERPPRPRLAQSSDDTRRSSPHPASPAPRRSRTPGEGSRPSWALVGRGIGSRGQEQIRGLSRAAPAIRQSYRPAGTAGNPVRTRASSWSAGSLGQSPPLCLMSCARMIQVLDPRPLTSSVMPVDVAMRLCLAHSPPLKSFLGPYDDFQRRNFVNKLKPLKPCLNIKQEAKSQNDWESSHNQAKKRVVFADSKGLSLTAIHVFSDLPEDPAWDLQFDLLDLNDLSSGLKLHEEKNLILDFPQPSTDYLSFRNHFQKNFVCLENCSLQERTVTGTVKVKNVSFEKKVQIRITFDTWKNYTNVDCVYMKNVYGDSDSDTFSFAIDLPSVIPTEEKIEFCISYHANGQVFWDNNEGQNYRIVHVQWKPDGVQTQTASQNCAFQGVPPKTELEPTIFGSPRLASELFPEWQSWGRMENLASYR